MRLCGISSRFQLLSPSTGQVTHALLTRPPLSYESLGFIITPFDLHVLSTPPAFILSQDQTLMLMFDNTIVCPASLFLALLFLGCSSEISLRSGNAPAYAVLSFHVWTFQGCIAVYLSRFTFLLSKIFPDSKIEYITAFFTCQQ